MLNAEERPAMKLLSPHEVDKPRTRRLRKKLRVGEFRELGLQIAIQLDPDAGIGFDDALDSWIDFVESQDWAFGGGGSDAEGQISGFATRFGKGTLTEEDRSSAKAWLDACAWVKTFRVSDLMDAWHGW
jgi:uncharacterized protein YggL (DUF469 family)